MEWGGTKSDKAEVFNLRAPSELMRRLEALAKREHRTVANVVRMLLEEALGVREQNEPRKAS